MKNMTITELREQLEALEQQGYGEYTMKYQDEQDMFIPIEQGINIIDDTHKVVSIY